MIVSEFEARAIMGTPGKNGVLFRKTSHRVLRDPSMDERPVKVGRDYAVSVMTARPESELYGFSSEIVVRPGQGGRSEGARRTRSRRSTVQEEACRVLVTDVRAETLADVDVRAAHAEGYQSPAEFFAAWCARFGLVEHDLEQPVWTLEFRLADETTDRVRLLGQKAGYTSSAAAALVNEPEAVDAATQESITAGAFLRAEQAAHVERLTLDAIARERSVEDAYRITRGRARAAGIDTSQLDRLVKLELRKLIERIERQKRRGEQRAQRRAA